MEMVLYLLKSITDLINIFNSQSKLEPNFLSRILQSYYVQLC